MVSAVSGLPAIFIDGFRELEKDFDLTNNRQSNVGVKVSRKWKLLKIFRIL